MRRPSIREENSNILEKLAAQYTSLTKSHKRLADCILSNPMQSIGQPISELALRAGVSDATVTRFCTEIGVSGYPDFRKSLIYAIENSKQNHWQPVLIEADSGDGIDAQKDVAPWPERLHDKCPQSFDDVVTLIANANKLILVGLGQAAFLCEFLRGHFAGQFEGLFSVGMAGVSVAEKQIRACDQKDALILLSNRDTLSEEKLVVQLATQKGIPVIPAQGIQEQRGTARGTGALSLWDSRTDDMHASLAAVETMRCVLAAALLKRNAAIYFAATHAHCP